LSRVHFASGLKRHNWRCYIETLQHSFNPQPLQSFLQSPVPPNFNIAALISRFLFFFSLVYRSHKYSPCHLPFFNREPRQPIRHLGRYHTRRHIQDVSIDTEHTGELFDQVGSRVRMMPPLNFRQIRLRDGPPLFDLQPRSHVLLGESTFPAPLAHH
jgi:hypothetical protein